MQEALCFSGRPRGGRAKMAGQNGPGISLAGLSVHGPWHAFEETLETRGPRHQPVGQDCQTTRHRLRQSQDFEGQACCRSSHDQSHRGIAGQADPNGKDREENHANQSQVECLNTCVFFFQNQVKNHVTISASFLKKQLTIKGTLKTICNACGSKSWVRRDTTEPKRE